MTSFTVDPAALSAHAGEVRHIAEMVGEASAAASAEGIGGLDAYGLICSPLLIPALQGFFGDAGSLVKDAADLGQGMAEGLQSNSDVYSGMDQEVRDSLHQVRSDLF